METYWGFQIYQDMMGSFASSIEYSVAEHFG